jgi:hypothetical protein
VSYTPADAVDSDLGIHTEDVTMADVLYVVLMIALTGIAAAFVIGCDKIVGRDDVELAEERVRDQREREFEELAA